MKKILRHKIFAFCLGLMILSTLSAFAEMSLSDAKSQGLVGEKSDGYVGIVGASTPELQALVSKVNDGRREIYQKAVANDPQKRLTLQQVEQLGGERALNASSPGQFIFMGGQWKKK